MPKTREKPKPVVLPHLCKGCGRCVEACPKQCFEMGTEINPDSGLIPVEVDLENCNGCG
ncbi:MAG: 4Fe-4S dicluster domain-containing protein, partial [Gammaproteobacteria bacterium]|nr:4Fe-4S dicluster domain-containing protein [Gammaproteobacteria bacterium]NIW43868.1 4Fe-4S dicluster domain-containing protein [Gammaproteobacteria bacterium]NIW99188.1 4Fe-4S dicluster domain-containing protein [Phycisphaerae bacterium]